MKESVQKFDLEAAFKALDEVEIPVVKGIRANRENLQEKFTRKLTSEILVEDYFDVGDAGELEQASEEREAEIAKAKLARIEKIVDLDADSEEDLLPSYVGKLIMQCPQCMTLFYKNEEDIEKSEENPDVVNLNEPCQHCGNTSGYTLVGKVDTVGEEEASEFDVEDFDENELDLDFDEEPAEEEEVEEPAEEAATEEEEELDLEPIEDEESEEEVKESLTEGASLGLDPAIANRFRKDQLDSLTPDEIAILKNPRDREAVAKVIAKYNPKEESLNEGVDKELEDKLKAHNDYIEYLKKMISQEEEALAKATNEFVKKNIQTRLDAFKADLEAALPEALKDEVVVDELPTPEEAEMEAPAENKEDKKEKKESLTEHLTLDSSNEQLNKLATAIHKAFEAKNVANSLEVFTSAGKCDFGSGGHITIKTEDGISDRNVEIIKLFAIKCLEKEGAKAEFVNIKEVRGIKYVILDNIVISRRATLAAESLTEKLRTWTCWFDGRELGTVEAETEYEAAVKMQDTWPEFHYGLYDGVAEVWPDDDEDFDESLKESADLLADDGTLAMLINPGRWSAKVRKEKLLADPDFVKALEAFAAEHDMIAKPGDLEDGVSPVEDMYICAFEGITGKALEDTLDELISYYVDIRAGGELTEAAPQAQGEFVSKLKRNYSATEIMVKELKSHPFFSRLSTRTIQRVLLPYYIDRMGRKDLSTQSMIDFFTEEGFAPFVLDHFFTMDPLARKELLKADAKFMEIFNAYASEFKLFPGSKDDLVPGENEFDYAFSIAFDFGDENEAQDTEIARDTIKSFAKMYAAGKFDKSLVEELKEATDNEFEYTNDAFKDILKRGQEINAEGKLPRHDDYDDVLKKHGYPDDAAITEAVGDNLDVLFNSEEFKKPISEKEVEAIKAKYEALEEEIAPGMESEIAMRNIVDTWEAVEDIDDEKFNKLTESYLTEVYSNVKSFEATNCDLKEGKLVVEGTITFNSGKTKPTTFIYEAKQVEDKVILEGLNADFASEKAFTLNCKVDTANCLIVESLNYKYSINETLVEGLVK